MFDRNALAWAALACGLIGGAACTAWGGTWRDDLGASGDTHHQSLAADTPHVVRITTSQGYASGVLIDPYWVLTAAHVADDTILVVRVDGLADSISPIGAVANPEWASWTGSDQDRDSEGLDVALVKLSEPASGVQVADRYYGDQELGQIAFICGFGRGGTGLTGWAAIPSGTKRAGYNVIDETGGQAYVPGWSDRLLIADFDSPSSSLNPVGDPDPLPDIVPPLAQEYQEYQHAPGDSGGGWFIPSGPGMALAGIVALNNDREVLPPHDLDYVEEGEYGEIAAATRVSSWNFWIDAYVGGDCPAIRWNAPTGGDFSSHPNWSHSLPGIVNAAAPGRLDKAVFDLFGATYTVTLSGSIKNCVLQVENGTQVTFGGTYTYTADEKIEVSSGGQLDILPGAQTATADLAVGGSGSGAMVQTGGTVTVDNSLVLGATAASDGTYELVAGLLQVQENVTDGLGSGTLIVSGASATVDIGGTLTIDTLALSDGQLTSVSVDVGVDATANATHSGGTCTVSDSLNIGLGTNSNGTYNLSGGTLTADTLHVGLGGSGDFNWTGGQLLPHTPGGQITIHVWPGGQFSNPYGLSFVGDVVYHTDFEDCDSNGIPDECDLDCGISGGPCDIPGCGQSQDVNTNGIPDDCESGNLLVLIDRTGSMLAERVNGHTRCEDALIYAAADVQGFFAENALGSAAVWTFTNTAPTPITGFVGEAAALAAINGLDSQGCTGDTPLAESICAAVDHLVTTYPGYTPGQLQMAISTDGGENNSSGECDGSDSSSEPPPSGNYDPGSWQQKVYDKVHAYGIRASARFWDALGKRSEDLEGKGLRDVRAVSDHVFFEDLAESTGGTYAFMDDDVPDDCNSNGVLDEYEIANCDPDDLACQDCNGNGVLDECEVFTGAIVYTNDFEGVTPWPEWGAHESHQGTTPNGHNFLGPFANDTSCVTLSLGSLPPHSYVTAAFDLYILESYDGNSDDNNYGPDFWSLSHSAEMASLLYTTFSNCPDQKPQAYPEDYPDGDYPCQTGATQIDTLGYSTDHGDTVYSFPNEYHDFTFEHTNDTLLLHFCGSPNQAWPDEGWGIDNLRIGLYTRSGDCNTNNIPDDCDIADGTSQDINGNGIPDECDPSRLLVNAAAAPDGDGTTWNTAYRDLQEALTFASASSGLVSEIWVAAGTYAPAPAGGDRHATFQLQSGLALFGGFAGDETGIAQRDTVTNETILTGDLNGNDGPAFLGREDNVYHVVSAGSTDDSAIIDGFTVRGGYADGTWGDGRGAGVYVYPAGAPTIRNCTITRNWAINGGGMWTEGSAPVVSDCTFFSNHAVVRGGGVHNYAGSSSSFTACTFSANYAEQDGGGVANTDQSSPLFSGCTFDSNISVYNGGGMYNRNESSPIVDDCTFTSNEAGSQGGGVMSYTLSDPSYTQCTFDQNQAEGAGAAYNGDGAPSFQGCDFLANESLSEAGGAIKNIGSSATFASCTFQNNTAAGDGGGVFTGYDSQCTFTTCVFQGNDSYLGGGGVADHVADTEYVNCTFDGNHARQGGGALSVWSGTRTFTGCEFTSNVATHNGGALYLDDNVTLTAHSCSFDFNSAVLGGGAFIRSTTAPTLTDCDFRWNDGHYGGALAIHVSVVNMANCTFQENGAIHGAGINSAWGAVPMLDTCTFSYNDASGGGGALYNVDTGSPVLNNCTLEGNSAVDGGAFFFAGENAPTITECTFTDNTALYGGAVKNDGSDPVFDGCQFERNFAFDGGAVHSGWDGLPQVGSCSFTDNSALYSGGAFYNWSSGAPSLTDCLFDLNDADAGGALFFRDENTPILVRCAFESNAANSGGAMRCDASSPRCTATTFRGNSAANGGAVWTGWSGSPELIECLFAGNGASESGGALWGQGSLLHCSLARNVATIDGGGVFNSGEVTVANSILWENQDANGNLESSQVASGLPDIAFSCVQGWTGAWGGDGNHGANPQFVDIDSQQLQLRPNSQCIDAGSNNLAVADLDDLDSDVDTTEMLPLDLGGNVRFADDIGVQDTGDGLAPIIDMGAFEFQGQSLPCDLDGDDDVDLADLTILVGCMNGPIVPQAPNCATADVDDDGDTDLHDFAEFQNEFTGAMP